MALASKVRREDEPWVITSIAPAAARAAVTVATSPVEVIRMSPEVEVIVAPVLVKAPEPERVMSPEARTDPLGLTVVPLDTVRAPAESRVPVPVKSPEGVIVMFPLLVVL
jgi:hypothetical protein